MTMVLEIDQCSHSFLPSGVVGYQQERMSRRCNFQSNANNDKYLRHYLPVDKRLYRIHSVEYIPSFGPLILDYFPQYASASAAISTTGSIIIVSLASGRSRIGHPSQSIHVQRAVNRTSQFAARAKSYCGAVA